MKCWFAISFFCLAPGLAGMAQSECVYLAPGVRFELDRASWIGYDQPSFDKVIPNAALSLYNRDHREMSLSLFTLLVENPHTKIDSSIASKLIDVNFNKSVRTPGGIHDTEFVKIADFLGWKERIYFSSCLPVSEEEMKSVRTQCNLRLSKRMNEDFWMVIHASFPSHREAEMIHCLTNLIHSIRLVDYADMDTIFHLPWTHQRREFCVNEFYNRKLNEHLLARKYEQGCDNLKATDYTIIYYKGKAYYDSLLRQNEMEKLDTLYAEIMAQADIESQAEFNSRIEQTAFSFSERMALERDFRRNGVSIEDLFMYLDSGKNAISRLIELGHNRYSNLYKGQLDALSILPEIRIENTNRRVKEFIEEIVTPYVQYELVQDSLAYFYVAQVKHEELLLFTIYQFNPIDSSNANYLLVFSNDEKGVRRARLIQQEFPMGYWESYTKGDFLVYKNSRSNLFSTSDILCYPIKRNIGQNYELYCSNIAGDYVLRNYNLNFSAIATKEYARWESRWEVHIEYLSENEVKTVLSSFEEEDEYGQIIDLRDEDRGRYDNEGYVFIGDTLAIEKSAFVFKLQNTIDVGKILYESGYIFQDIDHNGDEEIIEFSISNGQLKDYIIYTLEPDGLKKGNSRKWLRLLKKTDAYINLLAHSQIGCHKRD